MSYNTKITLLAVAIAAALAAAAYTVYNYIMTNMNRFDTGGQRPVNPVAGRVSSRYGERSAPVSGASTNHSGTDIAVPDGTPVRAPWDGIITRYWNDTAYGGGLSMLVRHPNGYTTGYCHLSGKPDGIQPGSGVRQGDVIAYTGHTGRATGPHLHFSVRVTLTGKKFDPEKIFDFQS